MGRNLPSSINKDGLCNEVINTRFKDGAWRPAPAKTTVRDAMTGSFHYIHQLPDDKEAFLYYNSSGEIRYYVYQGASTLVSNTLLVSLGTGLTLKMKSTQNTLIVSDDTGKKLLYALYIQDDESYTYIGEGLPEALCATISTATGSEVEIDTAPLKSEAGAVAQFIPKAIEHIAEQNKLGIMAHISFFRYAFELYDGSMIKYSQIQYIVGNTYRINDAGTLDWRLYYTPITTYRLNVHNLSAYINDLKNKYSSIIKNVIVFMTLPQAIDQDVTSFVDEGSNNYSFQLHEYSFEHQTIFYQFQSIPVTSLAASSYIDLNLGNVNKITTQKIIGVDENTSHKLFSLNILPYNSRLFLSNITNKLFKGFSPEPFISGGVPGGTSYEVTFVVEIATDEGDKIVVSDTFTLDTYLTGSFLLMYFEVRRFMYPDSRATKMTVYIDDGSVYKSHSWAQTMILLSHPFLNVAYQNDDDGWPDEEIQILESNFWLEAIPSVNNITHDENRIQASEVNNPYYFPAQNSYRVSNGVVLGLSSNSVALSEGQFGQHPLFAFTSEGVWALEFSTAFDVLISNIIPLNRLICNNADSITPIDGGVVFATENGLFIISGKDPVEISALAEGNYISPLKENMNYIALINKATLGPISDHICTDVFKTYLSGALIAYNHKENEIVVTNSSYDYSFVFNIIAGSWYKIVQTFDSVIPNYPSYYGVKGSDFYDLEEEAAGNTVVFIETRPMKFIPDIFKKIKRIALRCYLDQYEGLNFEFQLYGSTDNKTWIFLSGISKSGNIQDLILNRSHFSCRYFILVLAGYLGSESSITHIDADILPKFIGKLK